MSEGLTAVADGVDGVGTLVVGAPKGAARPVQIFVASTRPPERVGGGEALAGPTGAPTFSLTTISVPPEHEAGSIERPNLGSADRRRHFMVAGRRPLDEKTFSNEIASHISGRIGSNRDILLFVHGFNTSLDEARFRLAQIVVDGGFNGIPVLFTWPSKGSLFAYGSDRESAMASRDALEHVLEALAAEPDVGKVHVLAHSMGAWLAMEALRETAIAGHPDLDGHLGDIMLAAPDIDLDVFRQQMARLGSLAHVSIFAASNDRALNLSGMLADRPRLGALDPTNPADRQAIKDLGVSVVDISRESIGLIGHATYAAAPQIIRGIGAEIGAARPGRPRQTGRPRRHRGSARWPAQSARDDRGDAVAGGGWRCRSRRHLPRRRYPLRRRRRRPMRYTDFGGAGRWLTGGGSITPSCVAMAFAAAAHRR